jgi:putative IMPACT (imprinted ancient) family translation regulator
MLSIQSVNYLLITIIAVMEPLGEIAVADSRFLGFVFSLKDKPARHQEALQKLYPDAAHIPIAFVNNGEEGWDEDGEPTDSVGPHIINELKKKLDNSKTKTTGFAVAVVRFWGEELLGVTCGRLPQCYQSIAKLVLHRHFAGNTAPLEQEISETNDSVYGLAAGDCELVLNVVDDSDNTLFDKVKTELNFEGFRGAAGEVLPRLQNLQADLSENIIPVYRYPGNYCGEEWDTFEWSPASLEIKKAVEEKLLLPQTMNHCVTNYYRDGTDFIGHHSDKDLDLNRNGVIVSVSLGDERIMELKRRSEPKDTTRITLPPRSMLVLGPKTNKEFSHSILQKTDSNEARISLTLREVKTFKDLNTGRLFGQGVSNKSLTQLRGRYLIENSVFFSGFCALSAFMVSSKARPPNTTNSFVMAGVFALSTLSVRLFANAWYRKQEEKEAREFFSKMSMHGTRYN